MRKRDFLGGPVVKTPPSQYRGLRFHQSASPSASIFMGITQALTCKTLCGLSAGEPGLMVPRSALQE